MGNYAFIRNNNMKMGQLNNSYRHNERVNKNYANESIDKEKSNENYHFKEPQQSYEKTFWEIKEENKYLGNLRLQGKKQSNVACEFIIDVNKEYFDGIGRERTRQYFNDSYDFCKDKCGEKNIISATVHMDEGHPHMHVVYIPVIKGKDRKGQECERINCSKFWEGRDSYRNLQDEFYKHIQSRGYSDLQRGESKEITQREHLSVDEYKAEQSKMKQIELDKLEKIETEISPPEKKIYMPKDIDELKSRVKASNLKVRKLEYENSELRHEVLNLKDVGAKLKDTISQAKVIVEENKDLKNEKKIMDHYLEANPKAKEQMENYFLKMETLRRERKGLYRFKKEYIEQSSNIIKSQRLENSLKTDIVKHEYALNELKEFKAQIKTLEINLNIQKQKRNELGGVKNVFKRSERKELDNSIQEYENKLLGAKNDLKNSFKIEPSQIKEHIDLRKEKLDYLKNTLDEEQCKISESIKVKDKAELSYKYLDIKSQCYDEIEYEFVHTEAEKLKSENIKDISLNKITLKEKEIIFKNLPEEFRSKAKDILEPKNNIKDIIRKAKDFMALER